MRLKGASLAEIAGELEVTTARAGQLVEAATMIDDSRPDIARRISIARLEALIASLWEQRHLPAVAGRIIQADQRIAQLRGLDAAAPPGQTNIGTMNVLQKIEVYAGQLEKAARAMDSEDLTRIDAAPLASPIGEAIPALEDSGGPRSSAPGE